MLEQPELASDVPFESNSKRNVSRAGLQTLILESFGRRTSEEVLARLDSVQIANAGMSDMSGLWNHPQLQASKFTPSSARSGLTATPRSVATTSTVCPGVLMQPTRSTNSGLAPGGPDLHRGAFDERRRYRAIGVQSTEHNLHLL